MNAEVIVIGSGRLILALVALLAASSPAIAYENPAKVHDVPLINGITIDGDGEDWGERGYRVDTVPMLGCGLEDVADFDVRFRLGWNKEGLLALVNVRDDIGLENQSVNGLYRCDSVEMYLADRRGGKEMVQAIIAPGCDPLFPGLRLFYNDRRTNKDLRARPMKIIAASRVMAGAYQMEVLIPWDNLGVKPVLGMECGFNLCVNDQDVHFEEQTRTSARWYPENYTVLNTMAMYALRLAKTPSPPQRAAATIYHSPTRRYLIEGLVYGPVDLVGKAFQLTGEKKLATGTFKLQGGRAVGRFEKFVHVRPELYLPRNPPIRILVDEVEVGALTHELGPEIGFPSTALGAKIPRTMKKLATSTPEHRQQVKILFYGQSISTQLWWKEVVRVLKARFPYADLIVANPGIGGFGVPSLLRTGEHDIYPFYPDLIVFHAYTPQNGNLEQMVRQLQSRTTAEIMLWTHHISSGRSRDNVVIRDVAKRYGCELVDVEEKWIDYLLARNLGWRSLTRDGLHLNLDGCGVLAQIIGQHFQHVPGEKPSGADCIKVVSPRPGKDGSITLRFRGNRVELVAKTLPEGARPGSAEILIDGKKPSSFPELYQFERPSPGAWMVSKTAIKLVQNQTPLIDEVWRLRFTRVEKQKVDKTRTRIHLEFAVEGSKTGKDGAGSNAERFVSKSGRVIIDPDDNWHTAELSIPAKAWQGDAATLTTLDITWKVLRLHADAYVAPEDVDPSRERITVLASGLDNTKEHELRIIPNGNGDVPIRELRIYRPPLVLLWKWVRNR